jgi:hypothetical protein
MMPSIPDQLEEEARTLRKENHAALSWTACYDDACITHMSDKLGSGWYPQRKRGNRQNKKSKDAQERLSEAGDLPPYGENPATGEFLMMNAETPDETTKFVVIARNPRELFLVTPYWEKRKCWYEVCPANLQGEHTHPAFQPMAEEDLAVIVILMICRQEGCTVPGRHSHQGKGDEMTTMPIEGPEYQDSSICMMATPQQPQAEDVELTNEEENGWERTATDSEEDPEADPLPAWEDNTNRKYTILRYEKYYLTIVTNRWYTRSCRDGDCTEEGQHQHLIYDEHTAPQRYLRKIRFFYCDQEECEEKGRFHVHQWGDDDSIIINGTPEQLQEIMTRRREGTSLNMMVETLGTVESTIDERQEDEHISEYFECADVACSQYFTAHAHLFNIDPSYPRTPIPKDTYAEMMGRGMICEQQGCAWWKYLHVHFQTQDLSMMTGGAYFPEIIENVVDERADSSSIADYFECWDLECPKHGETHTHLCHVDPKHTDVAIGPSTFNKLEQCVDDTCDFEMWNHVHLPKNL